MYMQSCLTQVALCFRCQDTGQQLHRALQRLCRPLIMSCTVCLPAHGLAKARMAARCQKHSSRHQSMLIQFWELLDTGRFTAFCRSWVAVHVYKNVRLADWK